jgi:hypothetical protein
VGRIFVQAVQTDQGIQDQQLGLVLENRFFQPALVFFQIQAQKAFPDDMEVEALKGRAAGGGQALQAGPDRRWGVFSHHQQNRSGLGDFKPAQGRFTSSHGHR